MKTPVNIERGTTSIRVVVNCSGKLADAPDLSIFPFLRRFLTEFEWDYRKKKNNPKYYYFCYDRENGILYMPLNMLSFLQIYLRDNGFPSVIIDIPPTDGKVIKLTNSGLFEDRDYQSDAIKFLIEPGMRALELQTGCLIGDSIINIGFNSNNLTEIPLKTAYHLFNKSDNGQFISSKLYTKSMDDDEIIISHEIDDIMFSGIRAVYKLILNNGLYIVGTADHKIKTLDGWIPLIDCMNKSVFYRFSNAKLSCGGESSFNSTVVGIQYVGDEPTYDICCKDPYHNFLANNIVVSNSGKSYTAVRSIMEIGKRALISVPASLMVQWEAALQSMCDVNIGVIRGNETVCKLVANKYETDVDVFLASINTLRDYACRASVYNVLPPLANFMNKLKIGVKVVDECHINFNANVLIDIQCNIKHNLYLSATYMRSSKNSDTIFRRIFPNDIRYDSQKYNRYVNITEVRYSIGKIPEKLVNTDRGYSQFKYEKLLLRSEIKLSDFISRVLCPITERYFVQLRKPNQKLLILVGLREFADMLARWYRSTYPELNVCTFLHGSDEKGLDDADVILSTLGSAGTGRDIKNLKSTFLFTSFSSESLATQSLGRLRKLDNDTPEFVFLVNTEIDAHCRHAKSKQVLYKELGKTFNSVVI